MLPKSNGMNKTLFVIIVIVLVGIIAFAGWNIYNSTRQYAEVEEEYEELQAFIQIPTAPPTESPTETPHSRPSPTAPPEDSGRFTEPMETEPPETEPVDDTLWPIVDFAALKEINDDVVGWVYLEGTKINYPIVQGEDNSYYLRRLYTGKKNYSGCIFMDYRCNSDLSSPHTIIYGHNMSNKGMFADLQKFRRQSFYDEHPIILIMTPERNYKVEIFAGYVTTASEDAWFLDLNERNMEKWVSEVMEKSMFQTGITPQIGDQIFTLSTCAYDYKYGRLVVHGILR